MQVLGIIILPHFPKVRSELSDKDNNCSNVSHIKIKAVHLLKWLIFALDHESTGVTEDGFGKERHIKS